MGILDGKVAVVTGAGHGVGRGHAVQLAEAGAKVVVNDLGGSTRGEGADETVAQAVVDVIVGRGGEAVADASDVSSWDGSKAMIDKAVGTFGSLDIVVNNAGILRDKMIFNMEESDWDAVIAVHMKGHFNPTRHACAYWRDKSKQIGRPVNASLVHTSSSVGLLGNVGQANYAAAKGGIAMFSIAVAQDMERYGVRSNCVAPSGSTRLLPAASERVVEPDEYEQYSPRDPGNVGPLVVWLRSLQRPYVPLSTTAGSPPPMSTASPASPRVTRQARCASRMRSASTTSAGRSASTLAAMPSRRSSRILLQR